MPVRRRGDRGSSSLELAAGLPLLLVALLAVVQLLLCAVGGVAAQNAARTGARTATLGQDGNTAALRSLNDGLRDDAQVRVVRTPVASTAVVRVRVPKVLPLVPDRVATMTRSATIPQG